MYRSDLFRNNEPGHVISNSEEAWREQRRDIPGIQSVAGLTPEDLWPTVDRKEEFRWESSRTLWLQDLCRRINGGNDSGPLRIGALPEGNPLFHRPWDDTSGGSDKASVLRDGLRWDVLSLPGSAVAEFMRDEEMPADLETCEEWLWVRILEDSTGAILQSDWIALTDSAEDSPCEHETQDDADTCVRCNPSLRRKRRERTAGGGKTRKSPDSWATARLSARSSAVIKL